MTGQRTCRSISKLSLSQIPVRELTASTRPLFHPLANRIRQPLPDPPIQLRLQTPDQTLEDLIHLLVHQSVEGKVGRRIVRVDRGHADERLTPKQEES